ncbi:glucokinase, partial [Pseudoxanthomonas dokdonensis]
MSALDGPFIAADVGGTHVRIALVRPTGLATQPVAVLAYQKYLNADFASLVDIVQAFLATLGSQAGVRAAVIASAGYALEDGTVITNNLPWPLSLAALGQRLGLQQVQLVNDFEAVAHAAAQVDASHLIQLSGPREAAVPGPSLILGPGTGLGAAVWIPHQPRAVVLATEAGQAALAVGNALEMEVLRQLLKDREHVPVEHALSGPGLMNLYRALAAVNGQSPVCQQPDQVTAAALSGSEALAVQTLSMFCGLLGSTVGDMALLYGAQGGVYLAGGILPALRDYLPDSPFVPRLLNKGSMRQALQRIPVKVVEHGQLGVIGAASWFIGQPVSYKNL